MRIVTTGLDRPSATQLRAIQLGYLGAVPFGFGAVVTWTTPSFFDAVFADSFISWVLLYGAIIVSFMGGARWGAAIRDWRPDKLLITILPAFVAWLAVIPDGLFGAFGLDLAARFSVLLATFVLLLISELMASGEWAPWYRTLRMRLTLVTSAFLILTILGLIR